MILQLLQGSQVLQVSQILQLKQAPIWIDFQAFLATLVALHLTPVSKRLSGS